MRLRSVVRRRFQKSLSVVRLSLRRSRSAASLVILAAVAVAMSGGAPGHGRAALFAQTGACDPPNSNQIVCENQKPGAPASEWDVSAAGDASIQGFATDISVNRGETVRFKVSTPSTSYRLDIYRLGYYSGLGARKLATIAPSAALPQSQPACLTEPATGLVDCGNWAESASWAVPADAVSGIYIARLQRLDTAGASHIVFIVRDDTGRSDILFQTSDTTWQAYNRYGGNSLYTGAPAGRAYKVSYNRPFTTRAYTAGGQESWLFNAEYPMLRWLEANGFDVSYSTGVDTDRRGASLLDHKVFMAVGHDEYWSGTQRANVEDARNNGLHLAFFSGNSVFWKTRWESSIDGSGTSHRTLVCYKETRANAKIDPLPGVWTGTWRDPRFSPPADGGRPENGLTGTIFMVNAPRNDPMRVPAAEGRLRFWRNTSVAALQPGQVASFAAGMLGYEWDEDLDNGARPPGLLRLSSTTIDVSPRYLLDYGSTYGPGIATHSLTLYRHASGALVFSAGTIQWSWGLDATHDFPGVAADPRIRQATLNLLADMGAQPLTLQAGLVPAEGSADLSPPVSTISSPADGASVPAGSEVTVAGTATDSSNGVVGAVEVSVDNGFSWHRAEGRQTWTFTWTPAQQGTVTIRSRAIDDSGNIENPGAAITVGVTEPASGTCPCSLWPLSTVPAVASHTDTAALELGVRFSADTTGSITGIRFYKGPANTGVHIGSLWTAAGVRLATATFSNETAQGWQTVTFPAPVALTPGTTYIASYFAPNGGYARAVNYFTAPYDNAPLHAPAAGNGVYLYGTTGGFPTKTYGATNYWVDVIFIPGSDETPPVISGVQASQVTAAGATIQWSTNEPADRQVEYGTTTAYGTLSALNTTLSSTHSVALAGLSANTLYHYRVRSRDAAGNLAVSGDRTVTTAAADATPPVISGVQASQVSTTGATIQWSTNEPADRQVEYGTTTAYGTFSPLHTSLSSTHSVGLAGLSANMLYHYRVRSRDAAGNLALSGDFTFTTPAPGTCPCSLWPLSTVPAVASHADTAAVELGVRFSADTAGSITGIRFYKGPANTGVHVGNLWTTAGVRLATATFSNETAQGWQTVTFPTPVVVTAGTTYVASYFAPNGGYARTESYFTTPHDNAPLHAPATGNGVYRYGTAGGFPTKTYAATNYWVDVIFTQGSAPDTTPPGRSDGQPAGTLPAGTTQTTLSLTTSESATCRYAPTAGVSYAAMATTFGTTGGTSHATSVSGLASGTSYTYYVRCQDDAGNANPDDFTIAFAVATADTTPPVRSNGHPTGTLPAGTTQTTLSLTTSEAATCRYAPTAGVSYAAMATTFGTTGGTSHATSVSGLESGTTYTYYVRCQDGAGNGNPDDFTIAFAVATPDTTPPAVTMTEPANAAMTSGNISISATASDDIGVVGVQFLLNGSPIGEEDVDAPYSIQWNSRSVPDGSYELSARARDAAGNQTTASPITITVTNR